MIPKSNYQRQVEFRERNPGYYGRLHRKRNVEAMALGERRRAVMAMLVKPMPLMLPAPVESPETAWIASRTKQTTLEHATIAA